VGEEGFALAFDGATFGISGKASKWWVVDEWGLELEGVHCLDVECSSGMSRRIREI
jgi:hypothetical protein